MSTCFYFSLPPSIPVMPFPDPNPTPVPSPPSVSSLPSPSQFSVMLFFKVSYPPPEGGTPGPLCPGPAEREKNWLLPYITLHFFDHYLWVPWDPPPPPRVTPDPGRVSAGSPPWLLRSLLPVPPATPPNPPLCTPSETLGGHQPEFTPPLPKRPFPWVSKIGKCTDPSPDNESSLILQSLRIFSTSATAEYHNHFFVLIRIFLISQNPAILYVPSLLLCQPARLRRKCHQPLSWRSLFRLAFFEAPFAIPFFNECIKIEIKFEESPTPNQSWGEDSDKGYTPNQLILFIKRQFHSQQIVLIIPNQNIFVINGRLPRRPPPEGRCDSGGLGHRPADPVAGCTNQFFSWD